MTKKVNKVIALGSLVALGGGTGGGGGEKYCYLNTVILMIPNTPL